jgi:DNA-binding XRE family transcriptional regulator
MTAAEFKCVRKASSWTQAQAAARLAGTQACLSMVERCERAVSHELASRAVKVFEVPATALPLAKYLRWTHDADFFQAMLGSLGYLGLVYLRGSVRLNLAELLMEAQDTDDLDARATEALLLSRRAAALRAIMGTTPPSLRGPYGRFASHAPDSL